jgi:hypothetical protein
MGMILKEAVLIEPIGRDRCQELVPEAVSRAPGARLLYRVEMELPLASLVNEALIAVADGADDNPAGL